jgi:hypothetical protein
VILPCTGSATEGPGVKAAVSEDKATNRAAAVCVASPVGLMTPVPTPGPQPRSKDRSRQLTGRPMGRLPRTA